MCHIKEDIEQNETNKIEKSDIQVDESIYKYIFDEESEKDDDSPLKKAKTDPTLFLNGSNKETLNYNYIYSRGLAYRMSGNDRHKNLYIQRT